jgi:hypothetical protein
MFDINVSGVNKHGLSQRFNTDIFKDISDFITDVNSALGCLHLVDVGGVSGVLEEHTVSILKDKSVGWAGFSVYTGLWQQKCLHYFE